MMKKAIRAAAFLALLACPGFLPAATARADEPRVALHRGDQARLREIPAEFFSEFLGAVGQTGERFKDAAGVMPGTEDLLPAFIARLTVADPALVVMLSGSGGSLRTSDYLAAFTSGYEKELGSIENRWRQIQDGWRADNLVSSLASGYTGDFNLLENRWHGLRQEWRAENLLSSLSSAHGLEFNAFEKRWQEFQYSWSAENFLSRATGGVSSDLAAWRNSWLGLRRAWRGDNLLGLALTSINGRDDLEKPGWLNPARTCNYDAFVASMVPGLRERERASTVRVPWAEIRGALEYDRYLAETFTGLVNGVEDRLLSMPDSQAGRIFLAAALIDLLLGNKAATAEPATAKAGAAVPVDPILSLLDPAGREGVNALNSLLEGTESTLDTVLGRAESFIGGNKAGRNLFSFLDRLEDSLAESVSNNLVSRSAFQFMKRLDRSLSVGLHEDGGKESFFAPGPDFGLGFLVQGASDVICRVSGLDNLAGGRLQPQLSWSPEGDGLVALSLKAPELLSGLFKPLNGHVNVGGAQDKKENIRVYTAGLGFQAENWDIHYVYVYRTVTKDDSSQSTDQHLLGLTWHL